MGAFSTEIRINAPKEKVWGVLADLGGIYKWNPGVSHSRSTSEAGGGEGATRHCDLANPKGYLEERAFDWREGEGFKIDIYESSLPIERNVVEFTLRADGDGTIVSVSPDYRL
ncbi:MAG: SRPBCC family protein, partial [Chloroflexi bacterium]|nr:SRPBCC family protein [Chloroflexota bacterium]